MGIFFYLMKLLFLVGQAISLYIIINYVYLILPNSKPTPNKYANYALVAINYAAIIFFYSLH